MSTVTLNLEKRDSVGTEAAPLILIPSTRKVVYTVNVNHYAPELTDLTYPLMLHWCEKIGARMEIIDNRVFPEWPISFEKFQTPMRAKDAKAEWVYTIDSDTLIHPDWFDPGEVMGKDTVAHNGRDFGPIRWTQDCYFRRDGRHVGSCSWYTVASDWCYEDLWRAPEQSFAETTAAIHPTAGELSSGIVPAEHLCDDYTLSRNIARFGLKYMTFIEMCQQKIPGLQGNPYLWHHYSVGNEIKFARMCATLVAWGVMTVQDARMKGEQWGITWDACPGADGRGLHNGPCATCANSGVTNARRTR